MQTPATSSSVDNPKAPHVARPPGPPPRKGAADKLRFFANFYADPLGFVGSRFDAYGDIYFVPDGGEGLYVLRHPDHLRELLSTQASKFRKQHSAFEQLGAVLGEGLLTTDGETWKRQRRLVQPGFTKAKLASYAGVMVYETLRTIRALEGERDMGRELMELTLRAVSRTLFGHDAERDVETVGRSMQSLQSWLATDGVLPKWLPVPGRGSIERAIADLDRVVYGVIGKRQAELGAGAPARDDLLDALLTAVDVEGRGDKLSEREVRDQLMTLFLAGHETTSHALTWTLYLLSQNPGAREKVIDEARSVLGGRPPSIDDLPRLPFAEQVLKESLRLFPPAYLLARRASEDATIGGHRIPAGAEVIAWLYFTHRDARWFEDPHAFRPERFAKERESSLHPFAFIPFGAGPRACIGKSFAMLEAHLMLVTLSQAFRFTLAPGHRVRAKPRITLLPQYGMKMRVEPVG